MVSFTQLLFERNRKFFDTVYTFQEMCGFGGPQFGIGQVYPHSMEFVFILFIVEQDFCKCL